VLEWRLTRSRSVIRVTGFRLDEILVVCVLVLFQRAKIAADRGIPHHRMNRA
jgi:hypothetical protein